MMYRRIPWNRPKASLKKIRSMWSNKENQHPLGLHFLLPRHLRQIQDDPLQRQIN